jgi:hypothetical protein
VEDKGEDRVGVGVARARLTMKRVLTTQRGLVSTVPVAPAVMAATMCTAVVSIWRWAGETKRCASAKSRESRVVICESYRPPGKP